MTVAELINELQKLDKDKRIVYADSEYGVADIAWLDQEDKIYILRD